MSFWRCRREPTSFRGRHQMQTTTILARWASEARVLNGQVIKDHYEIIRRGQTLYVRMPNWPGVARVEPIGWFVQNWHAGRAMRRIFTQLGYLPLEVLDGTIIRTEGAEIKIRGGRLDGVEF